LHRCIVPDGFTTLGRPGPEELEKAAGRALGLSNRITSLLWRKSEELAADQVQPDAIVEDTSAYAPASSLVDGDEFKTYKAVKWALKCQPEIRTIKKGKNRLLVHAGDWSAMRRRRDHERWEAMDDDRAKRANG
jgi:hypothetical protein